MPRGGARTGAGRKKAERPTNANVASKVLAQAKAEHLWLSLISIECDRLGIDPTTAKPVLVKKNKNGDVIDGPDYQGKFSIIPITNVLRYLEDRAYGRPMDTVNHLHNKPLEVHHTFSVSERIKRARERVAAANK